jgi:Protein of unknown function (DUF2281)
MLETAILDNLEKLPDSLKEDVLHYVESLVAQHTQTLSETEDPAHSIQSKLPKGSPRAFIEHLKTLGTWAGDDQQDCFEAVQNSRGEAQFDYNGDTFDS